MMLECGLSSLPIRDTCEALVKRYFWSLHFSFRHGPAHRQGENQMHAAY